MDYMILASEMIKKYIDRIALSVWYDFSKSKRQGKTWNEDEILRSSIIEKGFEQTKPLIELNSKNPVYKIYADTKDIGGKDEETLTGADLVLIFTTKIRGKDYSKKLLLIQLKRIYDKGIFKELHHESGVKYYNRNIHQAQKMLLFSCNSFYALATNDDIINDKEILDGYFKLNLNAQNNDFIEYLHPEIKEDYSLFYKLDKNNQIFAFLPYLRIGINHLEEKDKQKYIKYYEENIPFLYLQALKKRLHAIANNQKNIIERCGLLTLHAERVWYQFLNNKQNSLVSLLPECKPFSSLVLENLIDLNEAKEDLELISAFEKNDRSKIIERIKNYYHGKLDDEEELPIAKRLVEIKIDINRND